MTFQQYPSKLGIPSGNTAARPTNPVIGDAYYNGELGLLEIFDGVNFVPCSSPAAIPSVVATDVGTARAYGSGQINLSFTAGTNGGSPYGYTGTAVIGATTYTTGAVTSNPNTLVVGDAGSYSISATAYNGFGTSPASPAANIAVTTVPQTPTIGTATASPTNDGEVTVTWTNGNNGGKNLSAITITPYLNGTTAATARTAATTSSTSYTFTNGQLVNGSSYTFKVKATNANGNSLESSASNSEISPQYVTVDYLVLAGGGAGGQYLGGGGGAGGLRSTVTGTGGSGSLESALIRLLGTNYTVTVGAGGAQKTAGTNGLGNDGSNSVFSTITSTGGGGGGTYSDGETGRDGGSGGGAGCAENTAKNGGSASPSGQGFRGGNGPSRSGVNAYPGSAGGGGASAQGVDQTSNGSVTASNGGNGRAISITGSSVTYGGGGGGGAYDDAGGIKGSGGSGGGGNGGQRHADGPNKGIAGTANLGAGGGGGAGGSTFHGGSGGSGVVILRWLTSAASSITVGAGLTADSTGTDGSYSYKRFTAGSGNVSFS